MKKLAIVKSDAAKNGGLEKYTARIKAAFEAKGCDVSLLSFQSKHLLSFQKTAAFDHYCQSHFRTHPYDVVLGMDRTRHQTHLRAGNGVHRAYLEMRKKLEGVWKGLSFSFNPLHRLLLKIEKEAFEDPGLKALITNSHMVQKQILNYYKTDPEKIHVLHNGVEWEEMAPAFETWPERKGAPYHFLFIGHNFQRKGLHRLLKALSCLQTEDFHLSVVGADKNRSEYETYVAQLGLSKQITFHGAQDSIIPFYQMADCVVIPSYYDPFANVTVEALAMGVFVISSDTNGGHEVLASDTGRTFTHQEELVEALKYALTRPKTWESSQRIRNSVRHLDFPQQLQKLCDLCLS